MNILDIVSTEMKKIKEDNDKLEMLFQDLRNEDNRRKKLLNDIKQINNVDYNIQPNIVKVSTNKKYKSPLQLTNGCRYKAYGHYSINNGIKKYGLIFKDDNDNCVPRRYTLKNNSIISSYINDLFLSNPNNFYKVNGKIKESFDTKDYIGEVTVITAKNGSCSIRSIKDFVIKKDVNNIFYYEFLQIKPSIEAFKVDINESIFLNDPVLLNKYNYINNKDNYINNKDLIKNWGLRGRILEVALQKYIEPYGKWIHAQHDGSGAHDFKFTNFTLDVKAVVTHNSGLCIDESKFLNTDKMSDLFALFLIEIINENNKYYYNILLRGFLTKQEILDKKDQGYEIDSGAIKYNLNMLHK
jgi:hypothetical protein